MPQALAIAASETTPLPVISLPAPTARAASRRTAAARLSDEDLFGQQPTPSRQLPQPGILLENLSRCVIEVLAGVRDLEQLARWVTEDVFKHLLKRVVLAGRARRARGQKAVCPAFTIGGVHSCTPRDGVVEASIVVRGRARARAVAIRLEGLDGRWRATALHVL